MTKLWMVDSDGAPVGKALAISTPPAHELEYWRLTTIEERIRWLIEHNRLALAENIGEGG